MNQEKEIREMLTELADKQDFLAAKIESNTNKLDLGSPKKKDKWDRLQTVAPILSGLMIASGVLISSYSYNQQQIKLQEIQTIEKFIPHLTGSEKSKKAAILAMRQLANTELAARYASMFASEGTVSALKKIAATGNKSDKQIANVALAQALENIAEKLTADKNYSEAENAYRQALETRERTYGQSDPEVPRYLDKLAELYKLKGDYYLAEPLLQKSLNLKEEIYGKDHPEVSDTLKNISELFVARGMAEAASPLMKRALKIDRKHQGSVKFVNALTGGPTAKGEILPALDVTKQSGPKAPQRSSHASLEKPAIDEAGSDSNSSATDSAQPESVIDENYSSKASEAGPGRANKYLVGRKRASIHGNL